MTRVPCDHTFSRSTPKILEKSSCFVDSGFPSTSIRNLGQGARNSSGDVRVDCGIFSWSPWLATLFGIVTEVDADKKFSSYLTRQVSLFSSVCFPLFCLQLALRGLYVIGDPPAGCGLMTLAWRKGHTTYPNVGSTHFCRMHCGDRRRRCHHLLGALIFQSRYCQSMVDLRRITLGLYSTFSPRQRRQAGRRPFSHLNSH